MKHTSIPIIFLALLLIISCKSEKKVTTYEELYKEQPFTILIVPTPNARKKRAPKTVCSTKNWTWQPLSCNRAA